MSRKARNECLKNLLNREKQREISWNCFSFTFTALADELLGSLFINRATKRKSNLHTFSLQKDGFVLMSGNEIVINYSKVKFVSVFFSFNFVCLFSKQSRKLRCCNFNGETTMGMHFDEPTRACVLCIFIVQSEGIFVLTPGLILCTADNKRRVFNILTTLWFAALSCSECTTM